MSKSSDAAPYASERQRVLREGDGAGSERLAERTTLKQYKHRDERDRQRGENADRVDPENRRHRKAGHAFQREKIGVGDPPSCDLLRGECDEACSDDRGDGAAARVEHKQ